MCESTKSNYCSFINISHPSLLQAVGQFLQTRTLYGFTQKLTWLLLFLLLDMPKRLELRVPTWTGCLGTRGVLQIVGRGQMLESTMHFPAHEDWGEDAFSHLSSLKINFLCNCRNLARLHHVTGRSNLAVAASLTACSSISSRRDKPKSRRTLTC